MSTRCVLSLPRSSRSDRSQRNSDDGQGHTSIVNNVVPHPELPVIASSGIDDVVKLWTLENLHKEERDSAESVAEALERESYWM